MNDNGFGAYQNKKKENEMLKKQIVVLEQNQLGGIRLKIDEKNNFKNIKTEDPPFRFPIQLAKEEKLEKQEEPIQSHIIKNCIIFKTVGIERPASNSPECKYIYVCLQHCGIKYDGNKQNLEYNNFTGPQNLITLIIENNYPINIIDCKNGYISIINYKQLFESRKKEIIKICEKECIPLQLSDIIINYQLEMPNAKYTLITNSYIYWDIILDNKLTLLDNIYLSKDGNIIKNNKPRFTPKHIFKQLENTLIKSVVVEDNYTKMKILYDDEIGQIEKLKQHIIQQSEEYTKQTTRLNDNMEQEIQQIKKKYQLELEKMQHYDPFLDEQLLHEKINNLKKFEDNLTNKYEPIISNHNQVQIISHHHTCALEVSLNNRIDSTCDVCNDNMNDCIYFCNKCNWDICKNCFDNIPQTQPKLQTQPQPIQDKYNVQNGLKLRNKGLEFISENIFFRFKNNANIWYCIKQQKLLKRCNSNKELIYTGFYNYNFENLNQFCVNNFLPNKRTINAYVSLEYLKYGEWLGIQNIYEGDHI